MHYILQSKPATDSLISFWESRNVKCQVQDIGHAFAVFNDSTYPDESWEEISVAFIKGWEAFSDALSTL